MKKFYTFGAGIVLAFALVTPGFAQNGQAVRAQVAKQNAQERVAEIRQKALEKKTQVREGICERRQDKLDSAIERLHTRSARLKTVIDTMYSRVQGFYESGQLTVENYDELKTAVDTASADADAAVSAVETFTITIDCQNIKLGEQLDSFRTAIDDTRTALKNYRKALVDLISAMNNSIKAEADSENDDDSSNGEEQ